MAEQLNEDGIALPNIGRSVHVDITGDGDWRSAIITRDWGSMTVQLTVFLDVVNDGTVSLRNGLYREGEALAYGSSVQHISEAGEGNLAWAWYYEVEGGEATVAAPPPAPEGPVVPETEPPTEMAEAPLDETQS